MKTYGKALLEFVVLVLFLLLFMTGIQDTDGNVGVFDMMGASLPKEQTAPGSSFTGCVEESTRRFPQIFYKKEGMLQTESYEVTELLEAVDCEGNALPLQIRQVWNPWGISEPDAYCADTGQLCFKTPGIYTLQIAATDAWNHTSVCKVSIPVNR